jgi:NTE family protein
VSQGITLVLGGGGFKGVAHVGALRALQAGGIPVERVVGTSAGALIGASYCYLSDAEEVHRLVSRFLASEGFREHSLAGFRRQPGKLPLMSRLAAGIRRQVLLERIFRRSSAFGGSAIRYIVKSLVPHVDIAELRIPLAIGVLDLQVGEDRLLTTGDLATAVLASSAVPGFFPPVEMGGALLCDAGLVNNLPTHLARAACGGGPLVAVDLSAGLPPCRADAVGMEILLRTQEISTRLANRRRAEAADVVVRPDLGGRHWLDAQGLADVIAAGEQAMLAQLPAIRGLLAAPSPAGRRAV